MVRNWILVLLDTEYPDFEIIGDKKSGRASEVLVHADMSIDPVFFLHSKASTGKVIHTEGQCRSKQINLVTLSGHFVKQWQGGPLRPIVIISKVAL